MARGLLFVLLSLYSSPGTVAAAVVVAPGAVGHGAVSFARGYVGSDFVSFCACR